MMKFYIVGTPIGNLEDITLRAIRILNQVDLILAEDTRETKKILNKYEIDKPVLRFDAKVEAKEYQKVINNIKSGKMMALVSDAGTPSISDPGSFLVQKLREEFGREIEIISIPGPSALTAALSISGVRADEFLFLGFLPHKKGRQTKFREIAEEERAVVFFESPHRIMRTLESLSKFVSINRNIIIARELTKIHEEVLIGSSEELLEKLEKNPKKQKGEFVVIVNSR